MTKKKTKTEDEAQDEVSLWLGDAQHNIEDAVQAFTMQWEPWPRFDIGVEVMDKRQLRDAMGVRMTEDYGDPWPLVERRLLDAGFRWQMLGSQRVMYLREKDDYQPDDGWNDGEEVRE